jgi:hypothetical protein
MLLLLLLLLLLLWARCACWQLLQFYIHGTTR